MPRNIVFSFYVQVTDEPTPEQLKDIQQAFDGFHIGCDLSDQVRDITDLDVSGVTLALPCLEPTTPSEPNNNH